MESWPVVEEEFSLSHADVRKNIAAVQALLARRSLDALVVTSSDSYLNEYTPLSDNQRYFLSCFNGSTALLLLPRTGRARLFVDGRYHLQADLQVDAADVEVVKVAYSTFISGALVDAVKGMGRVGYDPERLSKGLEESLAKQVKEFVPLELGELSAVLEQKPYRPTKPLSFIDPEISGRKIEQKLEAVFQSVPNADETAILVGALDDIAWLTDGRGYHFNYQSSFAARAVCLRSKVFVSVDPKVLEKSARGATEAVSWHAEPLKTILKSAEFDRVTTVLYDSGSTTAFAVQEVKAARPQWKLVAQSSPIVATKAVKTAAEIRYLEEINKRSARAIASTIRWVRRELAAGKEVSEASFYEAANGYYAAEGARDLSFHTIAAIGKDTAIIHFSEPKADVFASPDDMMLLDSGGLYDGGIATDITRTFLAGGRRGRPSRKAVEIYTLVAKGLLNAMTAIFPEGTRGSFLDALARQPIFAGGYDYGHGTGHGVGIHVHEPGVSLGPTSTLPIKANHVSSIEPGIYIPDFGGVRIENVVVYEPHPSIQGFLCARSLNFVALDPYLIDRDMMTPTELEALDQYQAECRRRGTDPSDEG